MTTESQIRVVQRARLEHVDRQAMRQWLGGVPAGTPVALEAAFGWPWIADLLEEAGLDPHLGHRWFPWEPPNPDYSSDS